MVEITTSPAASPANELEDIVSTLVRDNPRAKIDAIRIYASALRDYRQAEANIAEHGTIILHPRTSAPIDNPYCKVRTSAQSTMLRCKIKNVANVWPKTTQSKE